jgi:hypothetical protein
MSFDWTVRLSLDEKILRTDSKFEDPSSGLDRRIVCDRDVQGGLGFGNAPLRPEDSS